LTEAFNRLPEEKKKAIIDVCIDEFSEYGYEKSSTNRIVKKLGIAKGSLFKYFNSKEDLFLYILELISKQMVDLFREDISDMPADIIDYIWELFNRKMKLLLENPKIYKFFMGISDFYRNSLFVDKFDAKIFPMTWELFNKFVEGIDETNLKFDAYIIISVIMMVIAGIRRDMYREMHPDISVDEIADKMKEFLGTMLNIFKGGMYISEKN
jgi:AcrR family transcriptional regulator